MPRLRSTLALAALALLLAAATAAGRSALAPEAARLGRIRDPSWLPAGRFLRLVSFGQRLAVSDFYWLKTVQYIGEGFMEPERGWRALHPLAEIVTDLDPRHGYAYQMAALCLADTAGQLDEAYRLLDKGMRHLPDRWSLPLLYAQIKFIYQKDYQAAAEYARRAATAGKRPQLALLAAGLALQLDEEGEYRTAAAFLEETIPWTDEPTLRRDLESRLVKVRAFEALLRVEKAVDRFQAERVRRPFALEELVAAGLLEALPADPAGGLIRYHPADRTVESSVLGRRQPNP